MIECWLVVSHEHITSYEGREFKVWLNKWLGEAFESVKILKGKQFVAHIAHINNI